MGAERFVAGRHVELRRVFPEITVRFSQLSRSQWQSSDVAGFARERGIVSRNDSRNLYTLAQRIADDSPIDWSEEAQEVGDLAGALSLIEQVARSFRPRETLRDGPREPEFTRFTWGGLEVLEHLGAGSFGEVFRARDPRLDRDVALKLQRPSESPEFAGSRSFLTEAKRLAEVRHPHVVTIYGADIHGGRVGLWTELIDGDTLASQVRSETRFTPGDLVEIGCQLSGALDALHSVGLIHGDLKPANVLWDRGRGAILIDFGAASRWSPESERLGLLHGTPLALAPEQFEGKGPSPGTDVYALGALLFELATGRSRVNGNTIDEIRSCHRRRDYPDLALLRPDLPTRLRRDIEQALRNNPGERPESATVWAESLRNSLERPGNLPSFFTDFVGRARERSQVGKLVGGHRLVTLIGPGGSGKTRLAVDVAGRTTAEVGDGTWFLDLSHVTNSDQFEALACSILEAKPNLGLSAEERFHKHLKGQFALLVIDNCEHLLPQLARQIQGLLEVLPGTRVLTTSRQELGIPGEAIFRVPSLDLPASDAEFDQGKASDAIRLFQNRACAVLDGFTVAEQNFKQVASLCRRLDGIPLAIELTAARLGALTLDELESGTTAYLHRVAQAPGSRVARHRTLDAVIEWSHNLLSSDERKMFRRLAAFETDWNEEAALQACAEGELGADERLALQKCLHELSRKSLLEEVKPLEAAAHLFESDEPKTPRFRFLETIRQFASDRLEGAGESEAWGERYRDYFAGYVATARPLLKGPDRREGIARLAREYGNIRASFLGMLGHEGEVETAAKMSASLLHLWMTRGPLDDAQDFYEALLSTPNPIDSEAWRAVYHGAAVVAREFGHPQRSLSYFERALAMARRIGDEIGITLGETAVALMASDGGDLARARPMLEAQYESARRANDPDGAGKALLNLSVNLLDQGDFAEAEACAERAIVYLEQSGNVAAQSYNFLNRARIAEFRNDYDSPSALYGKAIELARLSGDQHRIALTLVRSGEMFVKLDEWEEARAILEEAVGMARDLGGKFLECYGLVVLARLSALERDWVAALDGLRDAVGLLDEELFLDREHIAQLAVREAGYVAYLVDEPEMAIWRLSWMETYRKERGIQQTSFEATRLSETLRAVRPAVPDNRFEELWAEGATLDLSAALHRLGRELT